MEKKTVYVIFKTRRKFLYACEMPGLKWGKIMILYPQV